MKKPDAQKNGLRILIVRISAIGDVLHVTSVVHNLRRLLPDAEITWLASPPASLLLETNPDIDRLLVWDRRPLDEASAHFDLRGCWRDGRIGFVLACFHYFYTMAKYVKLYYLDKTNRHVGDEAG